MFFCFLFLFVFGSCTAALQPLAAAALRRGWRVGAGPRCFMFCFVSTECVLIVHQEDSRTSNADGRLLVAYHFSVSSGLKPSFGLEVTRVKW